MGDSRKVRNCYFGQWGFRSADARILRPTDPEPEDPEPVHQKTLVRLHNEEYLSTHPWQRRGYPRTVVSPRGRRWSRKPPQSVRAFIPDGFGWWSRPVRDHSVPRGIRRHDREGQPLLVPDYEKKPDYNARGIYLDISEDDVEEMCREFENV